MQRRNFIRNAATAGAVAWISPLHRIWSAAVQSYPHQIPFVANPQLSGLSPEDAQALFQIKDGYTADDQASTYPQSVASGDPQANGIVLWTRIAPTAAGAPSGDTVAWQIASDASFDSIVINGVAPVNAAADYTVKLPVANAALASYSLYYYRFIYNMVPSRTGCFKTLPAADTPLTQLKIAYVVCQDYNNGYYTALNYLAMEDVEYVVHLENRRGVSPAAGEVGVFWQREPRRVPHVGPQPTWAENDGAKRLPMI